MQRKSYYHTARAKRKAARRIQAALELAEETPDILADAIVQPVYQETRLARIPTMPPKVRTALNYEKAMARGLQYIVDPKYRIASSNRRLARARMKDFFSQFPVNQENIDRFNQALAAGEAITFHNKRISNNAIINRILKENVDAKVLRTYRRELRNLSGAPRTALLSRLYAKAGIDPTAAYNYKWTSRYAKEGPYWFGNPARVKTTGENPLGQMRSAGTNARYIEWFKNNYANDVKNIRRKANQALRNTLARIYRQAAEDWLDDGNAAPYHGYY